MISCSSRLQHNYVIAIAYVQEFMPVIKTSFIAIPRATKRIGGGGRGRANTKAGQIQNLGPHKMGGSGHTPPGDFTCSEVCSGGS